jgi:hypothetical protein
MWMTVTPDDNELEIQWGHFKGPHGDPYRVKKASVLACSAQVRRILDKLSAWYVSPQSVTQETGEDQASLLRELVKRGYLLRRSLFDAKKDCLSSAALQGWITSRIAAGDHELSITTDPDLDVPWGLVWDSRPSEPWPGGVSQSDFSDFWCHKFVLSTVFDNGTDATQALPRDSFRIMSILNQSTFLSLQNVMEADHHAKFVEIVTKRLVGEVFKLSDWEEKIRHATHRDTLLHFFGHATNRELDLGEETIDVDQFKLMLDDLAAARCGGESRSLIFLNACDTANGELDNTFRAAAWRRGYCGFIGTEAKVPKSFAAKFGHELLRSILSEGNSVGQAMSTLRKKDDLWPLSLLYCCYAPPEYRVLPPSGETDPLEKRV